MKIDPTQVAEQISYLICSIRDPERQGSTLSQLDIVHSDRIIVKECDELTIIEIYLKPTNPSCHLVQQIALSIYLKLEQNMNEFPVFKLQLKLQPHSHNDIDGVEKQINDKQRVIAALQNTEIRKFIESLINAQ